MKGDLLFNSSPIIFLAKSGLFHVVEGLARRAITTEQVVAELSAKPGDVDVAAALSSSPWLEVVPVSPQTFVDSEMLEWNLGLGETSVLAAAKTFPGIEVVLDDRSARRAAKAATISCVGTLGLLIRAREANLIASFHSAVKAVVQAGLYTSPGLLDQVLKDFKD